VGEIEFIDFAHLLFGRLNLQPHGTGRVQV
jgi:hypothetical protein